MAKHPIKKWEVTIIELKNSKKKYKVTRRLEDLGISETLILDSRQEALKIFEKWLQ